MFPPAWSPVGPWQLRAVSSAPSSSWDLAQLGPHVGGQGRLPRESLSPRPLMSYYETESLSPPQVSPRSFLSLIFSKAEQVAPRGGVPWLALL